MVELDEVPANHYPDLVTRPHVQIRLRVILALAYVSAGQRVILALAHVSAGQLVNESVCFVCKEAKDDFIIFFLIAPIIERILIHFGQI